MLENTLPQLEQLIEKIIEKNNKLTAMVAELEQKNVALEQQKLELLDENETFQLEVLENEEKQKQANSTLSNLLNKLQSVEEVS
jgi:cell division protein ZapB